MFVAAWDSGGAPLFPLLMLYPFALTARGFPNYSGSSGATDRLQEGSGALGYRKKATVLILGIICLLLAITAAVLGSPSEADQTQKETQPLSQAESSVQRSADSVEPPEASETKPADSTELEASSDSKPSEETASPDPAPNLTISPMAKVPAEIGLAAKPSHEKLELLVAEESVPPKEVATPKAEPKPTPEKLLQANVSELKKKNPGLIARIISATKGLIGRAVSWLGTRYVWGGISKKGVDCSGFTRLLYLSEGVRLPHSAKHQFKLGRAVARTALLPGDLVFFNTRGPISHVGMYIGNGKFIHAANPTRGVRIDSLSSRYYSKRFAGARRYKSLG